MSPTTTGRLRPQNGTGPGDDPDRDTNNGAATVDIANVSRPLKDDRLVDGLLGASDAVHQDPSAKRTSAQTVGDTMFAYIIGYGICWEPLAAHIPGPGS